MPVRVWNVEGGECMIVLNINVYDGNLKGFCV